MERWLISYADFITLLFALFVVLYALSEVDAAKLKKVANSFQYAFGVGGTEGAKKMPVMEFEARDRHIALPVKGLEEISRIYNPDEVKGFLKLKEALQKVFEKKKEVGGGEGTAPVDFEFFERGLVVRFQEGYIFESGKAKIREETFFSLDRMGKILKDWEASIIVEGFMDSNSSKDVKSPSNWNISVTRAAAMAQFFVNQAGFPPHLISTGVYGDSRLISSKDTEKGKEPNRVVDIVILSKWEKGNEP